MRDATAAADSFGLALPFFSSTNFASDQRTSVSAWSRVRRRLRRLLFERRFSEKCLVLLGAAVLISFCFSLFLYLPDENATVRRLKRLQLKQQVVEVMNKADQFVLPPPHWYKDSNKSRRHDFVGDRDDDDVHFRRDKELLQEKIEKAQIPRPDLSQKVNDVAGRERTELEAAPAGQTFAQSKNDGDRENEMRREKIKAMMLHAWDGYRKYAWGANELRPHSLRGHTASIFGATSLGATIIDGMDTLYIMGFKERFQEARKWVEMSMDFSSIRGEVSVFETNIRFIGGLLAAYALTKDDLFRTKAKQVADLLLPAFDTPTGIPHGLLNVRNKVGKNWGWASAGSSILSEYGTLHLEFEYLSVVTGESVYAEKVQKIRHVLNSLDKPKGLYPNYLNPKTRKWGQVHVSIGALGDSFYEYLLKQWIVTDGRDATAKRMYDETMKAFENLLLVKSPGGLTYFAEMRGSRLEHKMDHLACFTAGLYALQSMKEKNATAKIHALQLGRELGRTCRESYVRTETGIGPETFRFVRDVEAKTLTEREKYYILRPEAIEGWFYLWRATKEQMYRDWAWEAAQAIERYCRDEAGYSGIRNVYDKNTSKDDVQQSFFLAETLKYLFLIFSDDSVLSLDEWVFNTEAHPLPVRLEAHAAELRAREVKFV